VKKLKAADLRGFARIKTKNLFCLHSRSSAARRNKFTPSQFRARVSSASRRASVPAANAGTAKGDRRHSRAETFVDPLYGFAAPFPLYKMKAQERRKLQRQGGES
jgi:hypothetical protein